MSVHFAHFCKAYDLVVYYTVQFLFRHKSPDALFAYNETVIGQQFNGFSHCNAAYFKMLAEFCLCHQFIPGF